MIHYRYKTEPDIPVRFSDKDKRLTVMMIIDSSSTYSFIPLEIAKALGVD